MLRNFVAAIIAFFALNSAAYADCTDIIRASVVNATIAQDQSSLDQEVHDFCSAYSSAKSSGSAFNAGVSYGGIGLSGGSSKSEVDQVASSYCDSTNNYQARHVAYSSYVQSISPLAYSSYNACVTATANGWVTASLDPQATHPGDLAIVIALSYGRSPADVYFAPSSGISCTWVAGQGIAAAVASKHSKFTPGSSAILNCTRQDTTHIGSITIIDANNPSTSYTFPWKAYQGGMPVDELQAIKAANLAVVQSLLGSVIAFNSTQCPVGWSDYTAARGRFIRGIDPTGATDPDGTRTIGSTQEDDFKSHQHGLTGAHVVYPADFRDGGVQTAHWFGLAWSSGQPPTDPAGGKETRPKNVALLYCARN